MNIKDSRYKNLLYVGLITLMIAISAFISIPNPYLPFTLQMLVVFVIPAIFGSRLSFYGVLLYLVLGLIGLPIFASGGGISYFLRPSFGFLIGFLFAVIPSGVIAKRMDNLYGYILSTLASLLIIYSIGFIYFYLSINYLQHKAMDISTALDVSVYPFILPAVIKVIVAIILIVVIKKIFKMK